MATHRHTILVVDDEPEVLRSVQDLLRLDYRVLTATRAAEGLELLKAEEVHVVMTDQRMPEMTGVQLLHRIRGEYPEAIRLLFTGYADIRAVIDAINQGNVHRYITKPWDPDELLIILREACERYEMLVERRRLLGELQQKNQALAESNRALQEADRLKAAFIQVASHELRTPLKILLGMLALLERHPGTDRSGAWLRSCLAAAERLRRLVDHITGALQAGRFPSLERTPVDLAALLTAAAEDIRPFAEQRHHQLVVTAPPELGSAALDEEKVRAALDHLLLNAVKFTPDGGHLGLAARRDEDAVDITVSDDGDGIPPAELPHLGRPFFTGGAPKHHHSGHFEYGARGVGLGLAIVKAFAELHGGCLAVDSAPGRGSRFTLHLPVS